MYFFTADQHYGHANVIKYCKRPFKDVQEMDATLIRNHNEVVTADDTVVHAGDFTLAKREIAEGYIRQLNGHHIFISGSHDRWLGKNHNIQIWERTIDGTHLVACHYAMRTWSRSHYGSFHLHGHSHGNLPSIGRSLDVGVDCHGFYPVSFDEIKHKIDHRFKPWYIKLKELINGCN